MITIGFGTTKGPISWFIRRFTKSSFNRCWIRYQHRYFDIDMIVYADLMGIHEIPYSIALKSLKDVVELEPPEYIDIEYGLDKVGCAFGSEYDFSSSFYRKVIYAWRLLKSKIANPFSKLENNIHVNNVYRILTAVDDRFHDVDLKIEQPLDLHDRLIKMGWQQISFFMSTPKGTNGHT